MVMQQSSMLKFMGRYEKHSTSQFSDFSKEFMSTRCDTIPAVETPSDDIDIYYFESYVARCKLNSEQRFPFLTIHYTPTLNSSS